MKSWIITISRHHNTEVPDWKFNVVNKTREEAILEGYKAMINEFYLEVSLEDIKPILTKEEFNYKVKIEEEIDLNLFLWKKKDGKYLNMGVGEGEIVEDTYKAENRWLKIEERTNKNRVEALQAYCYSFDKLPEGLLKQVLECLDEKSF